jgi:hypothetical protein
VPDTSGFLGISTEAWTAIFTGISTLILGVGVPIAISTLRLITKQQYFASISRFNDELATTEHQRRFIFQEFQKKGDYPNIDPIFEQQARDVINFLNRVALLVDERLLPPRLVLSLTHTMIIRCWYQLEGYAAYQQEKLGGRYARRVKRLDERAKTFHDARPHQRIHEIRLWGKDGASIVVYKTKIKRGFAGVIQRGVWWARYILAWY